MYILSDPRAGIGMNVGVKKFVATKQSKSSNVCNKISECDTRQIVYGCHIIMASVVVNVHHDPNGLG